MSSKIAVAIKGLHKSFVEVGHPQDRFWQLIFKRAPTNAIPVLSDINLTIEPGQTVGLLGANGAGKSTLLSLICGILEPSEGSVVARGRVAAILELGTGFNPELTGTENLYLVAALRGIERHVVDEAMAEILEFAHIGEAIHHAMKTYSSGMSMRLAFALVVHLDPDILVIDEALAVGDEAFQSKCFQKLRQLQTQGVTIIFVSHASQLILELCDKAVLLDKGELLLAGEPRAVVDQFHKLIYAPEDKQEIVRSEIKALGISPLAKPEGSIATQVRQSLASNGNSLNDGRGIGTCPPAKGSADNGPSAKGSADKSSSATDLNDRAYFDPKLVNAPSTRFVNQGAKISDARLFCPAASNAEQGVDVNMLNTPGIFEFRYQVNFTKSFEQVRFGMLIKTLSGIELGGRQTSDQYQVVAAGQSLDVIFSIPMRLNPGTYFLNAGVLNRGVFLDRIIDAVQFRILPKETNHTAMVDFEIGVKILNDDGGKSSLNSTCQKSVEIGSRRTN